MAQAPFYKVFVAGDEKRDISEYVREFRFEDCTEEDNMVSLEIHPDFALALADDDDFSAGKVLSMYFGFAGGDISEVHKLRIYDVIHRYGSVVNMSVRCMDIGNTMRKFTSSKIWKGRTTKKIAEEIAGAYGLALRTDGPLDYNWGDIPQGNRSDMAFLRYLVSREATGNYIVFVRNNELNIVQRATDKESNRTYNWGDSSGTVISFEPTFKSHNRTHHKVEAISIDPNNPFDATPKIKPTEAESEVEDEGGTIRPAVEGVFGLSGPSGGKTADKLIKKKGGYSVVKVDPTNQTQTGTLGTYPAKVSRWYDANGVQVASGVDWPEPVVKLIDAAKNPIEVANMANSAHKKRPPIDGRMTIVLDPTIKPNTVITIGNVALRHSGNWLVVKVTHAITVGDGGTTVLEMRKNGTKKGSGAKATDKNNTVGPNQEDKNKKTVVSRIYGGEKGDLKGYTDGDKTYKTNPAPQTVKFKDPKNLNGNGG